MTHGAESPRRANARFARLVIVAAVLAALCTPGCKRNPVPGGANNPRAEAARHDAELQALNAVKAGAGMLSPDAGPRKTDNRAQPIAIIPRTPEPPNQPAKPPEPASGYVLMEHVRSEVPYRTEAEADEDALQQARTRILQVFGEQDLPARLTPTLAQVREDYVRPGSRRIQEPTPELRKELQGQGLTGSYVFVEYDIQVTAEQLRALRALDRVWIGMRSVGGLAAASLLLFGVLRFDERTRAYRTGWRPAGLLLTVAALLAIVYLVIG